MRNLLLIILATLSINSFAGDVGCGGTISIVMDYPSSCGGNLAFKATDSGSIWLCSSSEKGNSVILTAFAAKKRVGIYVSDPSGSKTCRTLDAYSTARYIVVYQD